MSDYIRNVGEARDRNVGGYETGDENIPTAKRIDDLHTNADTDTRAEALHHTLGPGPAQAAAGNHTHDGGNSSLLWEGTTLSGSRGGNVALVSIIAALVAKGATDSTTS